MATKPDEQSIENGAAALVVGGGVAGLSAALFLADAGVSVCLVESGPALGGFAARLACKAVKGQCVACGACVAQEKRRAAAASPAIETLCRSRILSVTRNGRFAVGIRQAGPCGQPATALGSAPIQDLTRYADALIATAGFTPFPPAEIPCEYGHPADVITTLDLEDMLRETGGVRRPSDGAVPRRIAFIQCVGSRRVQGGHSWCSRVCCAATLRAIRRVLSLHPDTSASLFYMDLQVPNPAEATHFAPEPERLGIIREIPSSITPRATPPAIAPSSPVHSASGHETMRPPGGTGGVLELHYYDTPARRPATLECDLAVLAVGMTPAGGLAELSAIMGLSRNADGFAAPIQGPGIYTAGAMTGPMSISEAVRDALRVAARALADIRRKGGSL